VILLLLFVCNMLEDIVLCIIVCVKRMQFKCKKLSTKVTATLYIQCTLKAHNAVNWCLLNDESHVY
jgi:hypothetical protein